MRVYRIVMAVLLVYCPAFNRLAVAEETAQHVVPTQELRAAMAAKFAQRRQNIQEIQKLLSHQLVQKQVGQLVDLERIEKALPTLDDETLNELASESRKINDKLQAGLHWGAKLAIGIGILVATILIGLWIQGPWFG